MAFVHLNVHSQFSILDGAIRVKKLPQAAASLGQSAVALTDNCNLYGAVAFDQACQAAGVHPVIGASLWWAPGGRDQHAGPAPYTDWQLTALIENETGYKNLCQLITDSIFHGMHYRPRMDTELMRKHCEGLIWLTSGIRGPVRGPVVLERRELAERHLEQLTELLGPEQLYLELQDTGLPGDELANEAVRELSGQFQLQTVVTNAVHYLRPEDAPLLETLQAIGAGISINHERRRRSVTDQLYLKSEEEMRALFPEDQEALDRSVEIAERCQFKFTYGTYYFPSSTPPDAGEDQDTDRNWAFFYEAFPPPRVWGLPTPEEGCPPRPPEAGNLTGYFRWYCREGLKSRLQKLNVEDEEPYWERLQIEMDIVEQMGFPAYYLIVAEFINWAKDHDIPVGPGRGSAAGSLCAWATRITDIDPIRYDLLFERFLNPERVSMPDVDVDFCQDRREEVIEHTRAKYGSEKVSQIITYGNFQARLALKDVARLCDLSFTQANEIAKLVPEKLGIKLAEALEEESFKVRRDGDQRVRRILEIAQGIEGLTRQTGIHAAGVVIADRPLVELAPLYRDGPEGGPVVQYDMKSAEAIGMIKFDFLGLKTLDQIRDALVLIQRNTGIAIDIGDIPLDDEASYELLQRGDSLGVFQVESSGMRDLLTRLKPSCIDDIIALVALYRPGPLGAGMVDDFIDRKHGRQVVQYPFPELEPILKNTYGVVLYQEQVMQIAQILAGYSLGEADLLRRAMGKKKPEEMAKQRVRFLSGAEENGHDSRATEDLFDLLAKFAAYGFNKSHSAAYGYIGYQTAYLKANYRAEYMAALMTIDANNTDKIISYIGDCKAAGLTILPPDLNHSVLAFDVPPDQRSSIRFGLCAIKNLGTAAAEAILEAREACGGSFDSFMEFLVKLDHKRVNSRVLKNLVRCGALDWTGVSRPVLDAGIPGAVSLAQRTQENERSGQYSLFGSAEESEVPSYRFPKARPWSMRFRLDEEKTALGLYITGHPVLSYEQELREYTTCTIDQLPQQHGRSTVTLAGVPIELRTIRTRKGNMMAFVTLQDHTGNVECVFFSDAWDSASAALKTGQPVLVSGAVEFKADGCKLLADSGELLSRLREQRTQAMTVKLRPEDLQPKLLEELRALIERHQGRCRLHWAVEYPEGVALLQSEGERGVQISDELIDALMQTLNRQDAVVYR